MKVSAQSTWGWGGDKDINKSPVCTNTFSDIMTWPDVTRWPDFEVHPPQCAGHHQPHKQNPALNSRSTSRLLCSHSFINLLFSVRQARGQRVKACMALQCRVTNRAAEVRETANRRMLQWTYMYVYVNVGVQMCVHSAMILQRRLDNGFVTWLKVN